MALKLAVSFHGKFFLGDPIAAMHKVVYREIISDIGEAGAAAAAANLSPGRGLVTGALRASIEPRRIKASRYNRWTGRGLIVAGARGAPAPGKQYPGYPEKRNRAANRKVSDKYRYMYRAAALTQSWASGQLVKWSAAFVRSLNK